MKTICFVILFLLGGSQSDTVSTTPNPDVYPKKESKRSPKTAYIVEVSKNNEFNKAIGRQLKYEIAIKEEIDTLKPLIADR
jgi:hypothetical protein